MTAAIELDDPVYEPFALLGLWLDALYQDNAEWSSAKLIDVIIEEYSKVSYDEVIQTVQAAGLLAQLESIKLW